MSFTHPTSCTVLSTRPARVVRPSRLSTSSDQGALPSREDKEPISFESREQGENSAPQATKDEAQSAALTSRRPPSPMEAARKERAENQQEDPSWERWRVEPQEDRGDGWAYAVCPRCHGKDPDDAYPTAMAHLDSGKFFCAQCGHHGDASLIPSQYRQGHVNLGQAWWEEQTIEQLEQWLSEQLPQGLPRQLEVGLDRVLTTVDGQLSWEAGLVLPCRLRPEGDPASLMLLPVTEAGEFLTPQELPGTQPTPWGWDTLEGDEVIFVNHPFDRIALMMAGVSNVVCAPAKMNPLLPGGGDWAALSTVEKDLLKKSRVVMAMRDDEAGRKLEDELARRIGKDRCFRVRWQNYRVEQGTTSAQTVLIVHGAEALGEAISNATAFPVAGVHELYEVEEQFDTLYDFGLQPGVTTGWPTLDNFYTVKLGQWTVATGIPGHGKTTVVDGLAVNLAKLHGWKFGVFSPENQPVERHYASLMEKVAGQPFSEGASVRISRETKDRLKGWVNDHFKAILPDEEGEGNWSVDHILSLARTLVYRHGIKGLIIDPWSELNHVRPSHMNTEEFINQEIIKIRRFARTYGVHVWVVVHPNKLEKGPDGKYAVVTPYMLNGGAVWRNKSDCFLSIFRNLLQEDEEVTDIYIQKIRFKEVGRLGRASLRGDPTCGRLIDDIDQNKREASLLSPTGLPTRQLMTTERKVHPQGMEIQEDPRLLPSSY